MTIQELIDKLNTLEVPSDTPVWVSGDILVGPREPEPTVAVYPTKGRPFLGDQTHEVVEL